MKKLIGLLTAGGDSPGLNAAIRGIGKSALGFYGMRVIGFRDGFRGLMENRVFEDICVHPMSTDENATQVRGFKTREVLDAHGDAFRYFLAVFCTIHNS